MLSSLDKGGLLRRNVDGLSQLSVGVASKGGG